MKIQRKILRAFTLVEVLVVLVIGALLLLLLANPSGRMVPESKAVTTLETQGFTNVKIVDRDVYFITWKGGDKSDSVRFTARAINPAGKEVTVYVFSGWLFKGATIRTP